MCNSTQIYNSRTQRCIQNTARNRARIQNATKIKSAFEQAAPPQTKTRQKCISLCENFCRENVLGDGDCEFHSVAKIINSISDARITTADLRSICSNMMRDKSYITNEQLRIIRVAYQEDRADEKWTHRSDMDDISISRYRKRVSKAMLQKGFWGDQVTLNMLSYHFKVDFWVIDESCHVIHTTPSQSNDLALLYLHNMHYSPIRLTNAVESGFVLDIENPTIKKVLKRLLQKKKKVMK